MEEMCEGFVLKTYERIFGVEETFSARDVSRYFPKLKPGNFMQFYFEHLLVCLYNLDVIFICAMNLDEYFTKFISSKFLIFNLWDFLWYCWPKVQNEGNTYINLNNYHNCFFHCL